MWYCSYRRNVYWSPWNYRDGYLLPLEDWIFSWCKLLGRAFSPILVFNFQGNVHSIYAATHSESQFIKNLWSWAIIMLCSLELHVFHLAACLNWQVCVFLSWIFLFYFISVKLQEIKESVCIVIPISAKFEGNTYRFSLKDWLNQIELYFFSVWLRGNYQCMTN